MPDETQGPVIGDGQITLPGAQPPKETEDMADPIDLPANVAQGMLTDTAGNIQASNRNSRGVFDAVMGAIAGTVQSNFAEVGVLEGRAVSGVNATPIGAPSPGA